MSYKEHAGYESFQKLLVNKNRGKKFVESYYSTLSNEEQSELRSCIALFHGELRAQKTKYEALKSIADTMELAVETMNLTRSISSEDDESPRAKRARERNSSSSNTTGSSWNFFGGTTTASSTAPSN